MSHGRERKEKNCLNCGAIVQGRYCQACGQENIEPKESFWSMLRHFFEDITHFDGKFFLTLKDLLFRPGFLSAEYIKGRRQSYLHPVRMYVFTSAIFFLVFFSINSVNDMKVKIPDDAVLTLAQRDSISQRVQKKLKQEPDDSVNLRKQLTLLGDTSRMLQLSDLFPYTRESTAIPVLGRKYKSRVQYDSAQRGLPAAQKDKSLKKLWNKRAYDLNDKYKYDGTAALKAMIESFLHKLPYLLFVSLPFFALILKLLYVRRKNFFYADHGILSIHHYIFSFIILLLMLGFAKLNELTGWGIWSLLIFLTMMGWLVYLYLAMKKFYGQGRAKTFFKFLLLNITGLVLISVLMIIFFLFAVFQQ